jgi:hypothetical protein
VIIIASCTAGTLALYKKMLPSNANELVIVARIAVHFQSVWFFTCTA